MSKKNILVLSDWFVPGFKAGGPIKSLKNLIQNVDHNFFVITRITDYHSNIPYESIAENQWIQITDNCFVLYINENRMNARFLKQRIEERTYDLFYLNSLFSPRFTLLPLLVLKAKGLSKKVILAPRGMLKSGALQIKAGKKKYFLSFAKAMGLYNNILWHATNEEEQKEIKKYFGENVKSKLAPVIPSGSKVNKKYTKESKALRIVCLSRISPEKGIIEAIQAVCDIPNDHSVVFDLYGAHTPGSYTEKCLALANDSKHEIKLLGEVNPNTIPDILANYDVFLLATHGENFGHAIAEALLSGLPVVISNKTPWRDLEVNKAGFDVEPESENLTKALLFFSELNEAEIAEWQRGAEAVGRARALDNELIQSNRILFE